MGSHNAFLFTHVLLLVVVLCVYLIVSHLDMKSLMFSYSVVNHHM